VKSGELQRYHPDLSFSSSKESLDHSRMFLFQSSSSFLLISSSLALKAVSSSPSISFNVFGSTSLKGYNSELLDQT